MVTLILQNATKMPYFSITMLKAFSLWHLKYTSMASFILITERTHTQTMKTELEIF